MTELDGETPSVKRPRRRWPWGLGVILIAVVVIFLLGRPKPMQSDPTRRRSGDPYVTHRNPAYEREPEPPPFLMAELEVSTNNGMVTVRRNSPRPPPASLVSRITVNVWDWTVPAREQAPTPPAIWLEQIELGYIPLPVRGDPFKLGSLPVVGRAFGPGMVVESDAESGLAGSEVLFRGRFPRVSLLLRPEEDAILLEANLHDARTRKRIGNNEMTSRLGDTLLRVQTDLAQWHAAPVDLILDTARGPIQTHYLPARVGETMSLDHWRIEVVAFTPGKVSRFSSSQDVLVYWADSDSFGAACTAILRLAPLANMAPIRIDLVDAQGDLLPVSNRGTAGDMTYLSAARPLDQVDRIRLTLWPRLERTVIRIPEMPGLPEVNRGVTNLFDVRLPLVVVRTEVELRQVLEGTLQMDLKRSFAPAPPTNYFPRAFTNATPRELLREYCRLFPKRLEPVVDEEALIIELKPTFLQALLDRFRILWGKLF